MAKHLDKFSRPFQNSPIPFVLAEALTNGTGDIVDLVCRFLNPAAAALLQLAPEEVQDRRLSQFAPLPAAGVLAPVQAVAFSGSSASFPYVTAAGQALSVTCYQVMYGIVALLLDPQGSAESAQGEPSLPDALPCASLELSREGLRCRACNRQLCQLSGRSQKVLLEQQGSRFPALVEPADWPALLQELLDAARERRTADQDFRLLRADGSPVWVSLRAEVVSSRRGITVFRAVLWDIDRLRREGLALRKALSQQEAAGRMLDQMPVGLCLLRSQPGRALTVLRMNREFSRLVELSPDQLEQRLQADPGSFLPPADREELLSAAVRARAGRSPLRRVCRVLSGSGQERFFSLHIAWEPQADGSSMVSIACVDASQDAADQAEHRARAQMCDLLLEHTSLLTLDYDPVQDLAQIQRHSPSGRRTSRTVSGYLKSLSTAAYLHPEDRRRLAGAIRRALTHPGAISSSYRADYEGTGWRRYRVSWMSLFDEQGDIRRLLGKAEDVTSLQAAEHFRQLASQHRKQARTCLAAARLDLTEQQRFAALFSPEALCSAFAAGTFQLSLEHRVEAGKYGILPVQTSAELAENPDTLHLEAFFQLRDRSAHHLRSALLDALASQDYALVLTADIAAGVCRAWGTAAERLPENTTFRSLAAWYLRQLPPTSERAALRKALTLAQILTRLETTPTAELELPVPEGGTYRLRCSLLEEMPGVLLVTCRQVPSDETPAPQA